MTFDIRRAGGGVVLSEGSKGRRDIWSSKEDAYATLKSRPAWEIWDDRVLRLYAVRRFFLFFFSPPLCGGTNRADVGEGDEVASDCVLPRQDPGRHAGVQSGSGNSAFPPLFFLSLFCPSRAGYLTAANSPPPLKACYRDSLGCIRVYDHFRDFVARQPTHIIYGAIDDYVQVFPSSFVFLAVKVRLIRDTTHLGRPS